MPCTRTVLSLCTLCKLIVHFACTRCALFVHSLCTLRSVTAHPVCAHHTLCVHSLCIHRYASRQYSVRTRRLCLEPLLTTSTLSASTASPVRNLCESCVHLLPTHCTLGSYPLAIHFVCTLCIQCARTVLSLRSHCAIFVHALPTLSAFTAHYMCTHCAITVLSACTHFCAHSMCTPCALTALFVCYHFRLAVRSRCTVIARCAHPLYSLCAHIAHSPCTNCALSALSLSLCTPGVHSVYCLCALIARSRCTHCALIVSVCCLCALTVRHVCTLYALWLHSLRCPHELPILFFVPTLVGSAIKADSVLRQQWPRGMYSKVSLASGLHAGEAVLHRGRAQWGRRTCMYCTLHAGGGACHDHRGSTPRKTAKLRLHQNQRAPNHQELTIRTYRGPLVQNRKTHTLGWKVKPAESLRRVHTAEAGTGAASEAYLPNGGPSELGEREVSAFSVGRPCKLDNSRAGGL